MKHVLVTTIGGGLFGIALGIAGFGPWQWQWWLIFLTALTWRLCGRMKSVQLPKPCPIEAMERELREKYGEKSKYVTFERTAGGPRIVFDAGRYLKEHGWPKGVPIK